ncbi:RNF213 [Mytilus edulis]|uniref:RNF213 n=1 Tax=Mytilus edulis TaxID=6550 RepID=A0A8S3QHT1_MYTED|nr:RNF213 [Mytilus edulis]
MVVAEKETVYNTFAIPLINRLEKHILSIRTILNQQQQAISVVLERWAEAFCSEKVSRVIKCLTKCQRDVTFWCSTPDAVLSLRSTALAEDGHDLVELYFKKQEHESLLQYLENHAHTKENMRIQMTTHSKLLSKSDMEQLCNSLRLEERNIQLLTLQNLDTEQQFCKKMRQSFSEPSGDCKFKLLIVQCNSGDTNADLIACASVEFGSRYILDDIHPLPDYMPPFIDMYRISMSASMVSDTDNENTLHGGKRRLDVAPLILSAFNKLLVLSKTKRKVDQKIEGLDLIFSLKKTELEENENEVALFKFIFKTTKSFTRGVATHLYYLLKKKKTQIRRRNGLSLAAASLDSINISGTFRRSVLQFIKKTLRIYLAGILAFADKNRNLDILINEHDWKRKIWLQILNSPTATGLQYGDLLNQKSNKMLSEFVAEVTSYDGKFFTGRLPFSWIIQRFIETLWTHILKRPDITEVYSVKTEPELQHRGNSRRFLFTLVACQANFYAEEPMYRHFEDITAVWPGCGEKVLEFSSKNPAIDDEMVLDLVGLHVLVENLHPPQTEALNSEEGKMEWMKKTVLLQTNSRENICVLYSEWTSAFRQKLETSPPD